MSRRARSYLDRIDYNDEADDTASIASTAVKIKDPVKKAWCQTQWTSLSFQARKLGEPEVHFDQSTNLLDKVGNKRLWTLLVGFHLSTEPCKIMMARRRWNIEINRDDRTVCTTSWVPRRLSWPLPKCSRAVKFYGIIMPMDAWVLLVRIEHHAYSLYL